ncbi:MAG: hypothetical protein HC896_18160 [Bacteroidales bacterium]|nr:hypothetical protein [Bacteroidales bacterium]
MKTKSLLLFSLIFVFFIGANGQEWPSYLRNAGEVGWDAYKLPADSMYVVGQIPDEEVVTLDGVMNEWFWSLATVDSVNKLGGEVAWTTEGKTKWEAKLLSPACKIPSGESDIFATYRAVYTPNTGLYMFLM